MPGSNDSFVPVGLPREASPGDTLDQRVGLHLLDALDSLDAVYESAAFFAKVAAQVSIDDYTLDRCLESVHADHGALWLYHGEKPVLQGDRKGASTLLALDALLAVLATNHPSFHNGDEARPLLRTGIQPYNVLVCPIHQGTRRLGFVAVLTPPNQLFHTGDVKLLKAVTSQAAIALSRAQHYREVEIERRKLQLVVENHTDGIAVLDACGVTTVCNPIARQYCGTPDLLPLLTSLDPDCTMQSFGAGPTEREIVLTATGQSRIVVVKSRDIRSSTGDLANVILMLRDVTQLRREERLKRDFLSLISHKFRTPLTALICALQMMDGADAAGRDGFVAEMTHRAQDLSLLVDRLLYFTELLEGSWSRRGSTDLRQLCADLETHFRSQLGDQALEVDLAEDALEVPVPPSRLRVALMNLIDNAIKFGTSGKVWVRVTSRRTVDGGIAVGVEDRGPGIPADARDQIFTSFRQLESEFTGSVQGAGIGLAMVREITTGLGGRLDHGDAVPHGCVFTLTFPAAGAEQSA